MNNLPQEERNGPELLLLLANCYSPIKFKKVVISKRRLMEWRFLREPLCSDIVIAY